MANRPIPAALVSGAASNADSLHTHVLGSDGLTAAARASIWPCQRPVKQKPVPIWQDDMDTVARWTQLNGTAAEDAVNYRACGYSLIAGSWVAGTGHAIKLTKTAVASYAAIRHTFAAPLDLTKKHVYVRYYVHAGAGVSLWSNITGLDCILQSGANYCSLSLMNGVGGPGRSPGWHEVVVPVTEGTAPFDKTAVTEIKLNIGVGDNNHMPVVTWDRVRILSSPAKYPYVFTCDGIEVENLPAFAYLASRGIQAHLYVSTKYIGAAPGTMGNTYQQMTWDQINEVQAMGHLICNHTANHYTSNDAPYNVDWYNLPTDVMIAEVDNAARLLRQYTGTPYADYLATPGAKWDPTKCDHLLGKYVSHCRDCNDGLVLTSAPPGSGGAGGAGASLLYDSRKGMLSLADPTGLATGARQEQSNRVRAALWGMPFVLLWHVAVTLPTLAEFKLIVNDVLDGASASVGTGEIEVLTFADIMGRNLYA